MGRLTELFAFINEKDVPSDHEMTFRYSYIGKTKEVMEIRKAFLKMKREKKYEQQDMFSK